MGIVDIFSKRQRRLRGDVPDVYQYVDLPVPFRRQVIHILRDVLGNDQAYWEHVATREWFQDIHDILARELGVFNLYDSASNAQQGVFNFLLEADVENALSVIEVSFQVARKAQENHEYYYYILSLNMRFPEAVEELNARFKEHGIGYQLESNEIVRVDSQFLHQEAVKPALQLLKATRYAGANDEFRKAHEHYRHQRYGEAVSECLKALESTLKVICKKRKWPFSADTATAKKLLEIAFEKGLVPGYLESKFTGLRTVLESGVPTIRNRESSHGGGRRTPPRSSTPRGLRPSPDGVGYRLHLAMRR